MLIKAASLAWRAAAIVPKNKVHHLVASKVTDASKERWKQCAERFLEEHIKKRLSKTKKELELQSRESKAAPCWFIAVIACPLACKSGYEIGYENARLAMSGDKAEENGFST